MNTANCHPDLHSVLEAVSIHSPTQYSILGELRDFTAAVAYAASGGGGAPSPTGSDGPSPEAATAPPVFMPTLETDLYSRLYVRPSAQANAAVPSDVLAQRDHVSALSAANNGMGTWEPGWRIMSIEADGRLAVSKDQVTFWVQPLGLRTGSGKLRKGDFCRVWLGKEMRQLVPGFYFAFGNGDQQDRDTIDPLVRFYWHLSAAAAIEYMALVTTLFNRAGIPFRTKVMADPAGYVRADAGVLYLERRYFPAARRLVIEIHEALGPKLRPEVPMFTKALAPGLGLAEDPNNQLSFGQSRCRIAAGVMWDCFIRGEAETQVRLDALATAFRAEGLDPTAPFLDRGSSDFYTLTGDLSILPKAFRPPPAYVVRGPRPPKRKGAPKKRHR